MLIDMARTCPTRKRRYRDKLSAQLALLHTSRNPNNRRRQEERVYHCHLCNGWHLTSTPYNPTPR